MNKMLEKFTGECKSKYATGGLWKASNKFRGRGSQTPGKKKGDSCQADTMKKFFAKNSKSYKHPGYSDWCRQMDILNKGGK